MMAETRQRAGAQAQLGQSHRRMHEEHPPHHLPNILKLELERARQTHGALHPLASEMQVPDPVKL
jgi:hypothetical protein